MKKIIFEIDKNLLVFNTDFNKRYGYILAKKEHNSLSINSNKFGGVSYNNYSKEETSKLINHIKQYFD